MGHYLSEMQDEPIIPRHMQILPEDTHVEYAYFPVAPYHRVIPRATSAMEAAHQTARRHTRHIISRPHIGKVVKRTPTTFRIFDLVLNKELPWTLPLKWDSDLCGHADEISDTLDTLKVIREEDVPQRLESIRRAEASRLTGSARIQFSDSGKIRLLRP